MPAWRTADIARRFEILDTDRRFIPGCGVHDTWDHRKWMADWRDPWERTPGQVRQSVTIPQANPPPPGIVTPRNHHGVMAI